MAAVKMERKGMRQLSTQKRLCKSGQIKQSDPSEDWMESLAEMEEKLELMG